MSWLLSVLLSRVIVELDIGFCMCDCGKRRSQIKFVFAQFCSRTGNLCACNGFTLGAN